MLIVLLLLFVLPLTVFSARAASTHRRQDSLERMTKYRFGIETALYAVQNIRANNAANLCAEADLTNRLNESGYDGELAQRLLCEAAIGIQIFSDLAQAVGDLQSALTALDSLVNGNASPSRLTECQTLNVDTLDEAGLDGSKIKTAICNSEDFAISSDMSTRTLEVSTTTSISRFITANSSSFVESSTSSTSSLLTSSSTRVGANTPITLPTIDWRSITSSVQESVESGTIMNTTPSSNSSNTTAISRPVKTITTFTTMWVTHIFHSSKVTSKTLSHIAGIVTRTGTSTSTVRIMVTVTASEVV